MISIATHCSSARDWVVVPVSHLKGKVAAIGPCCMRRHYRAASQLIVRSVGGYELYMRLRASRLAACIDNYHANHAKSPVSLAEISDAEVNRRDSLPARFGRPVSVFAMVRNWLWHRIGIRFEDTHMAWPAIGLNNR